MNKDKILVIGACGQIGTDLIKALRIQYGHENVIAADIRPLEDTLFELRPYIQVNVMDKTALHAMAIKHKITQIYNLAATLSASGEKHPVKAWDLNMQGLLNVLDIAKTDNLRVFWPSSIAVFGQHAPKALCPQHTITVPTTVYGISKVAGEMWCKYYHDQYGVDVRSIRFPGLISHTAKPGGGTTDYAVDIFHQAVEYRQYNCYLKSETTLPMMYMPDAIRATMELMNAPAEMITIRTSYNLSAMNFCASELGREIKKYLPAFALSHKPDSRQLIAESWPGSIDDKCARRDWGWNHQYDMPGMVMDMLQKLRYKTNHDN